MPRITITHEGYLSTTDTRVERETRALLPVRLVSASTCGYITRRSRSCATGVTWRCEHAAFYAALALIDADPDSLFFPGAGWLLLPMCSVHMEMQSFVVMFTTEPLGYDEGDGAGDEAWDGDITNLRIHTEAVIMPKTLSSLHHVAFDNQWNSSSGVLYRWANKHVGIVSGRTMLRFSEMTTCDSARYTPEPREEAGHGLCHTR